MHKLAAMVSTNISAVFILIFPTNWRGGNNKTLQQALKRLYKLGICITA